MINRCSCCLVKLISKNTDDESESSSASSDSFIVHFQENGVVKGFQWLRKVKKYAEFFTKMLQERFLFVLLPLQYTVPIAQ
jgi:hypothetical protein